MTSTLLTVSWPGLRVERYRQAEQALWRHYGLEPTEWLVDAPEQGARIRVVEVGSGEPLLIVHGTFGGGPAFAALAKEMPKRRLLLMDRPGFGLSSPVAYRAATFGTTVADIQRRVLDGLGVDRVDVAGSSIGALFAVQLALHHPERVRRIVLLGAGPIVQDAGVPGPIRVIASPLGAPMLRLMRSRAAVRRMITGSGHGPALADGRIPEACLDWRVAVNRETDSMQHERDMVRAIVAGTGYRDGVTLSEAELRKVHQPTLMLYGTGDSLGSETVWRRVMDAMPGGDLVVLNGAGHMVWLDDPVEIARRMERFLS